MKQDVKAIQLELPLFPPKRIHHNQDIFYIIKKERRTKKKSYGVSPIRVLTKDLFIKKYSYVKDFLMKILTPLQTEVVLKMLRFWAYYGAAYFKAKQIYEGTCSKPTFWRTIKILEEEHLIVVINRFFMREKAQISNEYDFSKLLLGIAKYLSERCCEILDKTVLKAISVAGRVFWKVFWMRFDFYYIFDFLNCYEEGGEFESYF